MLDHQYESKEISRRLDAGFPAIKGSHSKESYYPKFLVLDPSCTSKFMCSLFPSERLPLHDLYPQLDFASQTVIAPIALSGGSTEHNSDPDIPNRTKHNPSHTGSNGDQDRNRKNVASDNQSIRYADR